jgi:hypothetical protein
MRPAAHLPHGDAVVVMATDNGGAGVPGGAALNLNAVRQLARDNTALAQLLDHYRDPVALLYPLRQLVIARYCNMGKPTDS